MELLATLRPSCDLTSATKLEPIIGGESQSVTTGVHTSATSTARRARFVAPIFWT
jgi:hypothetical protein